MPLHEIIRVLAEMPATPISLSNLYKFGNNPDVDGQIASAQFLHRELPIRFAQRVQELSELPLGLSSQRGVAETCDLYRTCVSEIFSLPRPNCPSSQVLALELSF